MQITHCLPFFKFSATHVLWLTFINHTFETSVFHILTTIIFTTLIFRVCTLCKIITVQNHIDVNAIKCLNDRYSKSMTHTSFWYIPTYVLRFEFFPLLTGPWRRFAFKSDYLVYPWKSFPICYQPVCRNGFRNCMWTLAAISIFALFSATIDGIGWDGGEKEGFPCNIFLSYHKNVWFTVFHYEYFCCVRPLCTLGLRCWSGL